MAMLLFGQGTTVQTGYAGNSISPDECSIRDSNTMQQEIVLLANNSQQTYNLT
jgi:hypothetical protein